MTTIKFFSKLLVCYVLMLALSLFAALIVFIFGVYFLYGGFRSQESSPQKLSQQIISGDTYHITPSVKETLEEKDIWLIVLDEKGAIEDSYRLPESLKRTYSLVDIAQSTRWYLEDYPVFSYVAGNHLVLLGYPKNSYARLPANYFQVSQFFQLGLLILGILFLLILVYFIIYVRAKLKLRKEFAPITQGLDKLSNNYPVVLDEKGNLSKIKSAINQASQLLTENQDMRSHWIRGVSHDLRTPLTLILGYTNQLQSQYGSSKPIVQIESKVHQMESMISNLNLSYLLENHSLEKEMQPVNISGLLRKIIADLYNDYADIKLTFHLPEEDLFLMGDGILLTRAINNLLLNSLKHNEDPAIQLDAKVEGSDLILTIQDQGTISEQKVLELNQKQHHYGTHGMGVLISKQIITLHHGKIAFCYANPGLKCTIILPLLS